MAKKKRAGSKRVVVVADLHCGHRAGLTPGQWQLNPENEHDQKWAKIQSTQWEWYRRKAKELQPVHLLLVLGDCCDGPSARAAGRDSIRPQRCDQIQMATEALGLWHAENIEMVYGTRYHVTDWETDIATNLGAKIGAHGFPEVTYKGGSVVFDIKHQVASSSIPHGRATAIKRARLWNALWHERAKQPRADYVLRGHVHYFDASPFVLPGRVGWAIICPALEGMGSEYGAEQCEGLVDFGLLVFDVHQDGRVEWNPVLAELASHATQTSKY